MTQMNSFSRRLRNLLSYAHGGNRHFIESLGTATFLLSRMVKSSGSSEHVWNVVTRIFGDFRRCFADAEVSENLQKHSDYVASSLFHEGPASTKKLFPI